jgi:hypothetical protein
MKMVFVGLTASALLLLVSCASVQLPESLETPDYPAETLPLYEPSSVIEYTGDGQTYDLRAVTLDTAGQVAGFYADTLDNATVSREEQRQNQWTWEGKLEGYRCLISADTPAKSDPSGFGAVYTIHMEKDDSTAEAVLNDGEQEAQLAEGIEWQAMAGESNNETLNDIRLTEGGGCIAAGWASVPDEEGNLYYDGYLARLSGDGAIQWQTRYGGIYDDQIYSIQPTKDGGFITVGFTQSPDIPFGHIIGNTGEPDCWVMKLTADGLVEWAKTLGGSGGDGGYCVRQAYDDGFIIAGLSESSDGDVQSSKGGVDGWLVKLSPDGRIEWSKTYGGNEWDQFKCIRITDDGYIVAGFTQSSYGDFKATNGNSDILVAKFSKNGDLLWNQTFGGGGVDEAEDIIVTDDGGYMIAGHTDSPDGDASGWHEGELLGSRTSDYWVIKLSGEGRLEWEKCLGGTGIDAATSLMRTNEGNYVVCGYTGSSDGDVTGWHEGYSADQVPTEDIWLVCLTPSGEIVWDKAIGSSASEKAGEIVLASDGSYIVGGASDAFEDRSCDFWIINVNQ